MDIKEAVYRRAFSIDLYDESTNVGCFYLGDTYDTRKYIKSGAPTKGEKTEILSLNEVVDKVSHWVAADEEQMAVADFDIDDDFTVEEAVYRKDSLSVMLLDGEGTVVNTINALEDTIQIIKDWLKDACCSAMVSLYITADFDYPAEIHKENNGGR
ncbi:hypothetical protein AGMMS49944_19030 [Spirochaetia bacterium]|nr:hypothetical protein AGMMS49944_19030 [Spirochaetia bacterium]